jgi:hypothetical protein
MMMAPACCGCPSRVTGKGYEQEHRIAPTPKTPGATRCFALVLLRLSSAYISVGAALRHTAWQ